MKIFSLAVLSLVGVLSLPAAAQMNAAPVPMTDQGLRLWVQAMPSDTTLANRLYRVIQECDCEPGTPDRAKTLVHFFDGLFHHHGYSYGGTVREYLQAYTGEGRYQYEGSHLLEPSGIGELMLPAIGLVQSGEGQWMVDQWVMSESDLAAIEDLMQRYN